MESLFLTILNMSINASIVAIVVILLRLLLKKAPRYIICLLWILVAVRLVCPFSIEAAVSLIPRAEPIPTEVIYTEPPDMSSTEEAPANAENNIIYNTTAPESMSHMTTSQIISLAGTAIWLTGIGGMLTYAFISYHRIRRRTRISICTEDNIYICDSIDTPFILGMLKPRIYLPSVLMNPDREYVIAHERAHIKRKDYLWKPLGFLMLAVYWFNPVLWVAYVLLCRDIELACDEKVIKEMGSGIKKDYSSALLSCSVPRKVISACPLAFGESGVKSRIKNVLNYKKPAFWISLVAIILCLAAGVCFLTNPLQKGAYGLKITDSGSDYEGLSIDIKDLQLQEEKPYIEVKWRNKTDKSFTCGESFSLYKINEEGEFENCRERGMNTFPSIGYSIPARGSFEHQYSLYGVNISEPGTYRFMSGCSPDGEAYTNYDVWVEFEIKEIPENIRAYASPITISSGSSPDAITGEAGPMTLVPSKNGKYIDNDSSCINIVWKNNLSDKKLSTDEHQYTLYKESNGEWVNCMITGKLYYTSKDCVIAPNEQASISYNLYGNEPMDTGIYKLEAHFSEANSSETSYTAWVEFMLSAEDTVSAEAEEYVTYYCNETESPYPPQLRLYTSGKRFELMISALSSYMPMGTFRTEGNLMTLTANDGNVYVFNVIDDTTLEFDADKSSDIPKYSFSSGEEAQAPFSHGSLFQRTVQAGDTTNLYQSDNPLNAKYEFALRDPDQTIIYDIDNDGIMNQIILGPGPTSGTATFAILATEEGEVEYHNYYQGPFHELSFATHTDGTLYIKGDTDHVFDIIIDGDSLRLYEDSVEYGEEFSADDMWSQIEQDMENLRN
ncbi:MAG: hypothetical protein IJV88_02720 [Ruminococcus sp.]|nr:hypothetical protein [Ruminococcus sp.]